MKAEEDEIKTIKKFIWWFVGVIVLISIGGWFFNRANRVAETAFIRYEEFQQLSNTCDKINTDLCNMRDLPENDEMFKQFSKNQRINTLKTQLNRWIEDYNGKSKMWNRSMWKSSTLPYQISTKDYHCYDN